MVIVTWFLGAITVALLGATITLIVYAA